MVHSVEMLRIYVETTIVSYHIGIAASHGMQFLLTWNCEHIANARRRTIVEKACLDQGLVPPVLCTPDELQGE